MNITIFVGDLLFHNDDNLPDYVYLWNTLFSTIMSASLYHDRITEQYSCTTQKGWHVNTLHSTIFFQSCVYLWFLYLFFSYSSYIPFHKSRLDIDSIPSLYVTIQSLRGIHPIFPYPVLLPISIAWSIYYKVSFFSAELPFSTISHYTPRLTWHHFLRSISADTQTVTH